MMTLHRPVAFPGTDEERAANYRTHQFVTWEPDEPAECIACVARTYHVAASYPCGVEPPRETVHTTYTASGGTFTWVGLVGPVADEEMEQNDPR